MVCDKKEAEMPCFDHNKLLKNIQIVPAKGYWWAFFEFKLPSRWYECDTRFEGTLHFKYFDHFGLEESDNIWAPGFCDWYTLQHYDRFNKAYKPFITYIEFDEPFSGTY